MAINVSAKSSVWDDKSDGLKRVRLSGGTTGLMHSVILKRFPEFHRFSQRFPGTFLQLRKNGWFSAITVLVML